MAISFPENHKTRPAATQWTSAAGGSAPSPRLQYAWLYLFAHHAASMSYFLNKIILTLGSNPF